MSFLDDLLKKTKTKTSSLIKSGTDKLLNKEGGYFNPTSNSGQNFWSSNVAQGLGNQYNVGKLVSNVATKTIPTFLKETYYEAPKQAGKYIGQGFVAPFEAKRLQKETQTKIDESNKNLQLAIELNRRGRADEANRLFEANKRLLGSASQAATQKQQEFSEGKRKAISGSIRTAEALPLIRGPKVAGRLLGYGLASGIGAATAGEGEDRYKAAGRAMSDARRYMSITQFTDPIIGQKMNKVSGNGITSLLNKKIVSGLGNVVEDELIGRLEMDTPDARDRLTSFLIGLVISNGEEKSERTIKQRIENKIKSDFKRGVELDKKDKRLVNELLGVVRQTIQDPQIREIRKNTDRFVKNELKTFTGINKPSDVAGTHTVHVRGGEDFELPDRTGGNAKFITDLRKEVGLPETGPNSKDIPFGLSVRNITPQERARIKNETGKVGEVKVKPILQEEEALAQEARKYKSAEEFAKKSGIVPEWGTKNQYYSNNPYKDQLDKMKVSKKYDIETLKKAERWELGQVLKDKPAFLSDNLPKEEVANFAKKHNLWFMPKGNSMVVAKNIDLLNRALKAIDRGNQRELGLALGYEDIGVMGGGKTRLAKQKLTDFYNQATKGVEEVSQPPTGMAREKDLTWARGTRAAGIQNAGIKNYSQATKVLEKAGELPTEIKTVSTTKDFIKNYYETKKTPVVGDVFVNNKGERVEIINIGDNSVDYFLKGKKKGIYGKVYLEKPISQPNTEKIIKPTINVKPEINTNKTSSNEAKLIEEAKKYKSAEEFAKGLEKEGKIVYHGTPKTFDKFDLSFVGERGRTEGRGFYFTDNKDIAEGVYTTFPGEAKIAGQGRVVEAYLDIKKPMSIRQRNITDSQLKEIVKEAAELNDSLIPSYGDNIDDVVKLLKENETDVDIISELGNVGVPTQELNNIVTKITGYDGIIEQMPDGKLLVAFNPDQIITKPQLTDIWNKAYSQPKEVGGIAQPPIGGVREATIKPKTKDTRIADILNQTPSRRINIEEIENFGKESGIPRGERPKSQPQEPIIKRKSLLNKTYEDLIRSSQGVIERSGKSGKKISNILNVSKEEGELMSGKQKAKLYEATKNLNEQERKTIADAIEGKIAPISRNQQKAVNVWNDIAADMHKRAKEAGLRIGKIRKYFPHDTIIKTKENAPEVEKKLSRLAPRRYGHLELARQSDFEYDKDINVLFDYIDRGNRRIADAKYFGKRDEKLYKLAEKVGEEGGDNAQVKKYLDQILGKNQSPEGKEISEKIRNAQTIIKLNPTTSLTNLTQILSAATRTDTESTAKAVNLLVKNTDVAITNAIKTNQISPEMKRVFDDYAGQSNLARRWLRMIGMFGSEKFNRIVSVNAGIEYGNKLIKQANNGSQSAIRELKRFGMTTKNADPLKIGRQVSEQTQFSTTPGELPYSWHTPLGKVATQFKSFSYKQTKYLGSELNPKSGRMLQELKAGNVKPLTNALLVYGVAAPIIGEVINDIKSLYSNKKREDTDTIAKRYISNILAASSFGLLDYAGSLIGEYGPGGMISAVAGPTASDLYKGFETTSSIYSGDKYELRKAARNTLGMIPAVGKPLANTVVPNSYIENYIGVNEGLSDSEKQTYKNLLSTNPEIAEEYKQSKQEKRKNNNEDSWLAKIFSKKGENNLTVPSKNATVEERKEFRSQVSDMLNAGGIPTEEVLKSYIVGDNDVKSDSIEERTNAYEAIKKAMDNEYYTDEQKQAIIVASGVDAEDYQYYELASKDQDVRLQEILPKLDNMEHEEIINFLANGRKVIAGKQLVSNGMLDYLYENGYISGSERKQLKAIKYDEIKGEFYTSKGSGGGTKLSSLINFLKKDAENYNKTIENILKSNYKSGSAKPFASALSPFSEILSRSNTNSGKDIGSILSELSKTTPIDNIS